MNKNLLYTLISLAILIFVILILKNQDNSEKEQKIIQEALKLYDQKKAEGMLFSSQCLGAVDGYAVDIVHVPRTEEDNKIENQCEAYISGKLSHFIELDKDGNLIKIR